METLTCKHGAPLVWPQSLGWLHCVANRRTLLDNVAILENNLFKDLKACEYETCVNFLK